MKLVEILSAPYEYEWNDDSGDDYEATFKLDDGAVVVVTFEYLGGSETFEVEFYRRASGQKGREYGMTGGGDALRIFSTVIKIMKDFVSTHKPKFMSFSTNKEEASRGRLYKRLIKKFVGGNYVEVTDIEQLKHNIAPGWFAMKKRLFSKSDHMFIARKDFIKETK